MKKLVFGLIAVVMFSNVGFGQGEYLKLSSELTSKIKDPVKIYLGENSTFRSSENQTKAIEYLEGLNTGTLSKSKLSDKELKSTYEELKSTYANDETYKIMQNIIKSSNSPEETLSNIENYITTNKIPNDKLNQLVLWHYSIQILNGNGLFSYDTMGKAGPCWAGIVGSAGLGAIAGASLGGVPTAGIGAAPGAIIGGICGALVGWSNC